MADEATVMALNVREMQFSISRSLVLVYETNNFAFIRYLKQNEVIKSHLIVFLTRGLWWFTRWSTGRAADKVSVTRESYCYEWWLKSYRESVVFPYLFWFLQLKFRLRNFYMFMGCLHSLNYSSVGMSILTSCAKVPDVCPVIGPFFFCFFLRNRKSVCHKTSYAFNKSELVKYIIFLVLSSIRTRNLPFSGPADCKFVCVHLKCFSLKVHTCRVS